MIARVLLPLAFVALLALLGHGRGCPRQFCVIELQKRSHPPGLEVNDHWKSLVAQRVGRREVQQGIQARSQKAGNQYEYDGPEHIGALLSANR